MLTQFRLFCKSKLGAPSRPSREKGFVFNFVAREGRTC